MSFVPDIVEIIGPDLRGITEYCLIPADLKSSKGGYSLGIFLNIDLAR